MAVGEAGEPRVLEEVSSGKEEEEGDEVEVEEEVDERGTRCLRHTWWINRPACRTPEGRKAGVLLSSGFVVSLKAYQCPRAPSPFRAEGALVDIINNVVGLERLCAVPARENFRSLSRCGCFSGGSFCICLRWLPSIQRACVDVGGATISPESG